MKQRTTIFFISLLICCWWNYGQSIVWEKKLSDINSTSFVKGAFQVVNQVNDDVALFLMNKQNVLGYLFDSSFKIEDSVTSISLPGKYKTFVGSSVKGDKDYYLYLTNSAKRKFSVINFYFKDRRFEIKEEVLNFKFEKFIQTFNINNQLVILTVSRNSSELNFYYFEGFQFTSKTLDLGDIDFVNSMGYKSNLYSMLIASEGISNSVDIEKISEDNPNAIESTSAMTKIYQDKDEIIITFDEFTDFTQILTLNPFSLSYTMRKFDKPLNNESAFKRLKANTFKFRDKLFAFATTSDQMIFTVNDFKTGTLIKEFVVKEENSIYFKNTPIIQEGGIYDSHRELEKTKKFLRKTTSSEIGISVYKKDRSYHITLGGKKAVNRGGGAGMMGMISAPVTISGFGTVNNFYNPGYSAFFQYSGTKSTYINCLFDDTFEHIEGEMEKNVFDRIKEYKENNETGEAETLFRHEGYFVLGEYFNKEKTYVLRKFQD